MWEQIRANRRKSLFLVLGLFVILLIIGFTGGEAMQAGFGLYGMLLAIAIFLFQMSMYWFAAEAILLSGMGARELQREDSPRLFNVIEEMKIASGLEYMPRVYLLDESAPNAFAIGRKPANSAIAVTTGLMYRLNRDELQGVIAHEVGHLKNHDVKFMTLAGVLIGSIVIMADLVGRALRSAGDRGGTRSSARGGDSGGAAGLIFVLIALLVIIVGPIVARMLYFAVSRQREYLADACAAQYTRYPDGLASALLRISGAGVLLPVASKVTAPMFIINPLAAEGDSAGWFATHPPTAERVRILKAMGGASLADYQQAFEKVHGGSAVGQESLAGVRPLAVREPGEEEPIESKTDAKATAHRAYGYIEVVCQCHAVMRVPESYNENTIVCLRCSTRNAIPTVKERAEVRQQRINDKVAAMAPLDNSVLSPLQFTRVSAGWQSFRCECGGTVQLSPTFSAPRTFCPKCCRTIDIASAA